jgi:hypothetical protein
VKQNASKDNSESRSSARTQHYVPRLVLNSFTKEGRGKKRQIFVYDKHTDRSFRTSVDNVFAERDFNTATTPDGVFCLENGLGNLENVVAPIIADIIRCKNCKLQTAESVAALSLFTAIQRVRGTATRAVIEEFTGRVRQVIESNFEDNAEVLEDIDKARDPDAIKLQSLNLMQNGATKFAQHIASKQIILFSAPIGHTFVIGDSPVVLHNDRDFGPYGNLGLGVPGIQIYFPISPELALGFFCPTIVAGWKKERDNLVSRRAQAAALAVIGSLDTSVEGREAIPLFDQAIARYDDRLARIANGNPLLCHAENTKFMNFLQISQAERYVASVDGEFSLIKTMISNDERFRGGHHPRMD